MPPQRIALEVGGHPVIYTMGVQQWAEPRMARSRAQPRRLGHGGHVKAAAAAADHGARTLGLFHVLDKGQFSQVDSPTPLVTWTIPGAAGKISVSYESQPGSSQHPFKPGYLRGAVPDSL